MIVSCPDCSSRYRIREEKIAGRGARITCPKCAHKFVVHKEDEPMVVGAVGARGVPVTVARGGDTFRAPVDEDDEADVPTTVMPHGSQLAQTIRAAAEAVKARQAAEAAAQAHEPTPQVDGNDPVRSLRDASRATDEGASARAPAESGGGGRVGLLVASILVLVMVAVALVALGIVPLPAVGAGS